MENTMRAMVRKIMDEYPAAKREVFAGHPMGTYFRQEIPHILFGTGLVDKERYVIRSSVGQGNWAAIPWIAVMDRKITVTATKGVYIVYLLSSDASSLYLTLIVGCTEIQRTYSAAEANRILTDKVETCRKAVDARGFCADNGIHLGDHLTALARNYERSTIFYREYVRGKVPSEEELREDLRRMMDLYREYARVEGYEEETEVVSTDQEEALFVEEAHGEPEVPERLSVKETLTRVCAYIRQKGFSYPAGLIENFYLSLKSKPFVILAGTSGTGKTRLVRLFAEAVGATTENGRYRMVSVRPDWSDSSDLFGHVDLNGRFVPGSVLDFFKRAEKDAAHPYFLCLDEMNLARVEYYLSDILSVMETREYQDGAIFTDPILSPSYYGSDREASDKYGTVRFPENLYLIGTVNMDETTFPFSRKVLDRANTIEFSYVDLMPGEDKKEGSEGRISPLEVTQDFLKSSYLLLEQCLREAEDPDEILSWCAQLQKINQILKKADAQVGYRVRDEIIFYLQNNKTYGLLPFEEAMDNALMQKILPRLQGRSAVITDVLYELFKECTADHSAPGRDSETLADQMERAAGQDTCLYGNSAKKIAFMMRRYEEDGFTSYWF